MKNSFGNSISITVFGESHGVGVGVLIDGITPGLPVDEASISHKLALRRPSGAISTSRCEADDFVIQSGVFNGYTTGTPLCIFIPNSNIKSRDYTPDLPRPSHADLTAREKYHGFEDYRGGGHFSGRITAGLVAAGAIVTDALQKKGIFIGSRITRIADTEDKSPTASDKVTLLSLADSAFAVLDKEAGEKMKEAAEAAAADGDSVGGVLETVILGLPAGLGEPWFDGIESQISRAIFGIPAVKGIEFGGGFALSEKRGSDANDPIILNNGKILTETNNSGGICGGITNGMPVVFRTAVKPTPSIAKSQKTVDLRTQKETELSIQGRHDPCIVHRARSVIDSVTALVIADMLISRYGSDALL